MEKINSAAQKAPFKSELDNVFHPEQAFEHPQHVAEAPDLTLNEKCDILASWAGRALARKRLVTALTDEALTQPDPVDAGAKVSPICDIVPAEPCL